MSFWTRVTGGDRGPVTPNGNPEGSVGEGYNPGDPDGGIEFQGFDVLTEKRSLPVAVPSPWSGWPKEWGTGWDNNKVNQGINQLADIAWACLDLNTNVLSSMPVYHMSNGRIVEPTTWMHNPDPLIYTSWQEFAKQLFWDYQMGEAFVMNFATGSDLYPLRFRVIPPWLVNVEMGADGERHYSLGANKDGKGGIPVDDKILHIRYASTTTDARGHGPLEQAGARLTTIRLLQKYATNLAETGGVPQYWIGVDRVLRDKKEATDLLEGWIETRAKYAGHPAVLGSGASLNQATSMNARDMALMELSSFNESRITVLLGVPPALVGLAGAAGSLTYSNITNLFDFHDRSSLRPKARAVMEALSSWALPRGRSAELNRDDYTRLPLDERMAAYKIAIEMGILSAEEVRIMERYVGESSSQALTGGSDG